jgi:hypothetical protein
MKRASISLLIPFIFIVACSGGGTTFHGNIDPPPPAASFDIDSGNAMVVAGAAYGAVVSSGDLAGLAANTGLTLDAGGNFAKPAFGAEMGGALGRFLQKVPLGPDVYDCLVPGGTVTFSAEIVDVVLLAAGMLSVGDTFLVEYVNCDDGAGEVIDGTIDMTVDAFDGNVLPPSAYDMTMVMNVTDFQVTTATDVQTSNGDATARLNTLQALYVEASVSGNAMTMDTNSTSDTLSAYSTAQTLDVGVSPSPYTMSASGTLDSSQLAGVIRYSTPVTFVGFDANYPHTGELFVEGENSSARLVADNEVDVHIDIDLDGNGTVDETIVTTWAELEGM